MNLFRNRIYGYSTKFANKCENYGENVVKKIVILLV